MHLYIDSIGLKESMHFMKLVYRVKSFLTDILDQKGSKKLCDVILSQKSYTPFRLQNLNSTWNSRFSLIFYVFKLCLGNNKQEKEENNQQCI